MQRQMLCIFTFILLSDAFDLLFTKDAIFVRFKLSSIKIWKFFRFLLCVQFYIRLQVRVYLTIQYITKLDFRVTSTPSCKLSITSIGIGNILPSPDVLLV